MNKMIPKTKNKFVKPLRISEDILDKKKVNFTTLKKIIDDSLINRDMAKKLLLKIESHIRYRNEKRVHTRGSVEFPEILMEIKRHFSKKYAETSLKHQTYHMGKFLGYLARSFTFTSEIKRIQDCRQITKAMVLSYEEHLVQRLHLGNIKKPSVYRMLRSMKIFIDMLSALHVNHIRYNIDPSLRAQGKRSNEYVNLDEVLVLLEVIEKCDSKLKYRDMSIILLIMELGCRPIEVSNLRMDDIRITERLITLRSVKSKTRTLKMSVDLTKMIQEYLNLNRSLFPIVHDSLFINKTGESIQSSNISSMFRERNIKAFSEMRFTAKALRHTYATNALDNLNDFDQVSEAMGHKHQRSTEWYIHRSVQRMLCRTLPHNPLDRFEEEI